MEQGKKKGKLLDFLDCKRKLLLREQDIKEFLAINRRVWLRVSPGIKPLSGKVEKKDKS
jgi:hypothetical protein